MLALLQNSECKVESRKKSLKEFLWKTTSQGYVQGEAYCLKCRFYDWMLNGYSTYIAHAQKHQTSEFKKDIYYPS